MEEQASEVRGRATRQFNLQDVWIRFVSSGEVAAMNHQAENDFDCKAMSKPTGRAGGRRSVWSSRT